MILKPHESARKMKDLTKTGLAEKNEPSTKSAWYLVTVLLLTFIFPVISILVEFGMKKIPIDPGLIGKWFIFWSIGIRLLTAGLKQALNPAFTAFRIFNLQSTESFVVIRELGFANIAIGIMGVISVLNTEWRQIAGLTGAVFFGLAGIQHFFRQPVTGKEMAALITDLLVFSIMLLYLFFSLFRN